MRFLSGSIVALALLAAPVACLADSTIGIDNHYGAVLDGFYLQALSTSHTPSDWSVNLLNDASLGSVIDPFTSDDTAVLHLDQDTCQYTYNVRVHWSDGSSNSWSDIDFCAQTPDGDFTSDGNDFWAVPS